MFKNNMLSILNKMAGTMASGAHPVTMVMSLPLETILFILVLDALYVCMYVYVLIY